jgi:hypothetical protein
MKPNAVRCIKCGGLKTTPGNSVVDNRPAPADNVKLPEKAESNPEETPVSPPKENIITRDQMVADLGAWGVILIILGFIHIIAAGILDPVWGVTIIIIGIVSLAYRSKNMYIVLGLTLITVGLLNISAGPGGWKVFGIIQIILGIKEMAKYSIVIDSEPEINDNPAPSAA